MAPAAAIDGGDDDDSDLFCFRRRRLMSAAAIVSLTANHAALPPPSRSSVPVCPSHRPEMPCVRTVVRRSEIAPGYFGVGVVEWGRVLRGGEAMMGWEEEDNPGAEG